MPVTHAFTSAKSDGADATLVQPSNWNANHVGSSDWDAVITKSADEDVTNNTLQDDNHLFFTSTSGKHYIAEFVLIYSSPSGGTTPDLKVSINEGDATFRGWYTVVGSNASGSIGTQVTGIRNSDTTNFNTETSGIAYVLWFRCQYGPAGGGTFKLQWAQNTTNANATRIHQNSFLRYKQID